MVRGSSKSYVYTTKGDQATKIETLARQNSMSSERATHGYKNRNVDFEFIFTGVWKQREADDVDAENAKHADQISFQPATYDESGVNVDIGSKMIIPIVTSSAGQKKFLKAMKRVAFMTKNKSLGIVEADSLKNAKEKICHMWGIRENDWRVISTVEEDVIDQKTGKQHHVFTTTLTAIKLKIYKVHTNSHELLPVPTSDYRCTELYKLNGDPITSVSIEDLLAYKSRSAIDNEDQWDSFVSKYPKSVEIMAMEFFAGATFKLEVDKDAIPDAIKLEEMRLKGANELIYLLSHREYVDYLPRCTLEVLADVVTRHDGGSSSEKTSRALWKMGNVSVYRRCMAEIGLIERVMDLITFRQRDYNDFDSLHSSIIKVEGIDDADIAAKFDKSPEFSLLQNCLGLIGVLSTDKVCRKVISKDPLWLEGLFVLAIPKPTSKTTSEQKGGNSEETGEDVVTIENKRGRLAAVSVANIMIREGSKIENLLNEKIMQLLEQMISQEDDEHVCDAGLNIIGNFVKHLQHIMTKHCTAKISMKMLVSCMKVLKRLLDECERFIKERRKLNRQKVNHKIQLVTKAIWACIINLKQHASLNSLDSQQVTDILKYCVMIDKLRLSEMGNKFLYFALSLLSQDETQANNMVDSEDDINSLTSLSIYLNRFIFDNNPVFENRAIEETYASPDTSPTKQPKSTSAKDRDYDIVVCCCILSILANISEHSTQILGGLEDSGQRVMLRNIGVYQKCVNLMTRAGSAIQEAKEGRKRPNSLHVKAFDLCTCIIKMLSTSDMKDTILKDESVVKSILAATLMTETELSAANLMITLNFLNFFSGSMTQLKRSLMETKMKAMRGCELEKLPTDAANDDNRNPDEDANNPERDESKSADESNAPPSGSEQNDSQTQLLEFKNEKEDDSVTLKSDEFFDEDADIIINSTQCLLDHMYRFARRWTSKRSEDLNAHLPKPILSKFFSAWCCFVWMVLDPESSTYAVPDILRHEIEDIDFTAYWGMFIAKRREELEATYFDPFFRGIVEVLQDIAAYHFLCKMNKARLLAITLLRACNQSARELAVAVPFAVSGSLEMKLAEIVEEESEEIPIRINTINLLIEARDVTDVNIDRMIRAIVKAIASDVSIDLQMCAAIGLSYLIFNDPNGKSAAAIAGKYGAADRVWSLLLTYMRRWKTHAMHFLMNKSETSHTSFPLELSDEFSTMLRCVLNLSIDAANQVTMAHSKGLREIVGFCIDLKSAKMDGIKQFLDPDVPGMLSSLLHNLASNLKNRTPLYKVELHYTAKSCRAEAGAAAKRRIDISRRKGFISEKEVYLRNDKRGSRNRLSSSGNDQQKAMNNVFNGTLNTSNNSTTNSFLQWLEKTFPDDNFEGTTNTDDSIDKHFIKSNKRRSKVVDRYGRPLSAPLQSHLSNPLKRYFNEPIDSYIAHRSSPWYVPIKDYREDFNEVASNARMSLTLNHPVRQLQTSMSIAAKTLSTSMTKDGFDSTQFGIDHLDFVRPTTPVRAEPMVMLKNVYGHINESMLCTSESSVFPTSPSRSSRRPQTAANDELESFVGTSPPRPYSSILSQTVSSPRALSPGFSSPSQIQTNNIPINSMYPDGINDADQAGDFGLPFESSLTTDEVDEKEINLKVAVEPVQQTSCISFRSLLVDSENVHLKERFELSSKNENPQEQSRSFVNQMQRMRRHFQKSDSVKKRMYTWPHNDGSVVYEKLFPMYLMPNGRRAFFYYQSGMLTDAMEASIDKNVIRPNIDMLIAFLNDAYPDGTLFAFGDGPMIASRFIELPPQQCPVPLTAVIEADVDDKFGANQDPDQILIEANLIVRTEDRKQFIEPKAMKPVWRIQDSIFAPRPKDCDSRNYFDTKKCLSTQFHHSFERLMNKERVGRFLKQEARIANKTSSTGNEVTVESLSQNIKTFFHTQWSLIISMFYYFCSLDENELFRMKLNSFTVFTDEAGIHDKESKFTARSELDTLFIVTNYTENHQNQASEQDLAVALTVAEFLEVLLRIAQAKFVKTNKCSSLIAALEKLFNDSFNEFLPEKLWIDPNTFRSNELYREEIDDALKRHESFIRALFNCYRFRMENGKRPNRVRIDTALRQMMIDFDLVGERLTMREALHLAILSRMEVDDIVGKWDRNRSLNFLDFCETLCRLAHDLKLPNQDELRELKFTNIWEYYKDVKLREASFNAPSTAPDLVDYTDDITKLHANEAISVNGRDTVVVGSVQKKTTGVGLAKENEDEKFILANQIHALINLFAREVIMKYPGETDRNKWLEEFGAERNVHIITEATQILKREEKKI